MRHWFSTLVHFGDYLGVAGFWFAVWFYRALLVTLVGGVAGVLFTTPVKLLFFPASTWGGAFLEGFLVGCQYAGLWASGISMVWVIMDRRQSRFLPRRFELHSSEART